MNEIEILNLFYDEMRRKGVTRDEVYLSMDEKIASILSEKLKQNIDLETVHKYTDICIANEWLERTTADPNYNFLSLTEAGLQIVLANQYIR